MKIKISSFILILVVLSVIIFICQTKKNNLKIESENENQNHLNLRPVIGIVSQPTYGKFAEHGNSYIAASYVKWIESAGARVIPILYDMDESDLLEVFSHTNGLLFPGGGSPLNRTKFYYTLEKLYNWGYHINENNGYYPIWGTCLGFEAIFMIVSKNFEIKSYFDAWNLTLPLNFTQNYKDSKLFKDCPNQITQIFKEQSVTLNNHHYGINLKNWKDSKSLNNNYKILSFNKDRVNNQFISTFEHNKYPIYGTQWHPEKVQFEWTDDYVINHSFDSIKANQYMGNFFVNEVRKNQNIQKGEEWKYLIYNFKPSYSYPYKKSFIQSYFFKKASEYKSTPNNNNNNQFKTTNQKKFGMKNNNIRNYH